MVVIVFYVFYASQVHVLHVSGSFPAVAGGVSPFLARPFARPLPPIRPKKGCHTGLDE